MPDDGGADVSQKRPPELPSGTFEVAHVPIQAPGVAGAVAASREGRNWLNNLGYASAPQFLALLVIGFVTIGGVVMFYVGWRLDNIVRQQVETGSRFNAEWRDGVERRMDNCERKHAERDAEHAREMQRQFEERQAQGRERERVLDMQKKTEEQVGRLLTIITRLDAKLKAPDGIIQDDTP